MISLEPRRSRSRSRERDEQQINQLGGGVGHMNHRANLVGGSAMQMAGAGGMLLNPAHGHAVGASALLMTAQQVAQDKINRELFVGNTPPGTSEMLLLQFLNGAMRRVQLCQPHETPILNCRVNTKFAFIELVNSDMANRALNLNGIPFLGAVLKVSRPSKYAGPPVQSKTWQEITGQSLPQGVALDAEQEKVNRELFIGNTTPEMTEQMLKDFLGNAMEQVGLAATPGNPITACRVSGKFAFIELRTPQEAAAALNLNNIPFLGTQLRVGRPSKWSGPPDSHGNWEDILAKYMSGELQLGQQQQQQQPQQQQYQGLASLSTASKPEETPAGTTIASRVVELKNMLTKEDLNNEEEYNDIVEDTREECSQFGNLLNVIIPKEHEPGATKIFLEYASQEDASKAIQTLGIRTFDGRKVHAAFFDEEKFNNRQFDDN